MQIRTWKCPNSIQGFLSLHLNGDLTGASVIQTPSNSKGKDLSAKPWAIGTPSLFPKLKVKAKALEKIKANTCP